MAVVAQLSVNLSAQTAAFSNGLKKANGDLKGFEKQAVHSQRTLKAFGQSFKQALPHFGVGGSVASALGGFSAVRFATDSLKEHAKHNRELQGTLDDLDKSFVQIKKNFGAWLVDVGGANSVLQKFNAQLAEMNGQNLDARQAVVSGGRLDNRFDRKKLEEDLRVALRTREIIQEQFDKKFPLPSQKEFALEKGNSPEVQQIRTLTKAIELLQQRLREAPTSPQFDVLSVFTGQLGLATKAFEPYRQEAVSTFNALRDGATEAFGVWNNLQMKALKGFVFDKFAKDAKDSFAAMQIAADQNPLATFVKNAAELKRLNEGGFLAKDAFNLALFDERQRLEAFAGLNDPIPTRVGGARRGSAEAFEKVAAFQDGTGNVVQRTLMESLEVAKEQLRVLKDEAARNRQEFDAISTIDTKP